MSARMLRNPVLPSFKVPDAKEAVVKVLMAKDQWFVDNVNRISPSATPAIRSNIMARLNRIARHHAEERVYANPHAKR